jgi:Zn ribbon nucleic-acid-binding protein
VASKKLRCRIGAHRWERRRNRENGVPYMECAECGKQKDSFSLTDSPGMN